jgi:uncharacterized protein YbjT (DUF2867 family)
MTLAMGSGIARLWAGETEERARAQGMEIIGPPESAAEVERIVEHVRVRDSRIAHRLVLGWIGTHPDAIARGLRWLWQVEEACRASDAGVVAIRLAPMMGPHTPLGRRLRGGPVPARVRHRPLQPVLEHDVVQVIDRIVAGRGPRSGWFEVCGPEIVTLTALSERARAQGRAVEPGAWEPDLDVLAEMPLVEPDLWQRAYGVSAGSVIDVARVAVA